MVESHYFSAYADRYSVGVLLLHMLLVGLGGSDNRSSSGVVGVGVGSGVGVGVDEVVGTKKERRRRREEEERKRNESLGLGYEEGHMDRCHR